MCIRVQSSSVAVVPWDDEQQLITVPAGLSPEMEMLTVRAVLEALAIPQPEAGAVCHCGAQIDLGRQVRTLWEMVRMHIGAQSE